MNYIMSTSIEKEGEGGRGGRWSGRGMEGTNACLRNFLQYMISIVQYKEIISFVLLKRKIKYLPCTLYTVYLRTCAFIEQKD